MSTSHLLEPLECDEQPDIQTRFERFQHVVSNYWKNILIGLLFQIVYLTIVVFLTYFLARENICEADSTSTSTKRLPIYSAFPTSAPGDYSCADGFTYVNHKCWKFVTGPQRRADADKACFNLDGSTLFSIRNEQENQAALEFVKDQKVDNLWTGLMYYADDPFSCTWDVNSGTTEAYHNFAEDHPNNEYGDCIYYMTTGTQAGNWANGSCTETMSFVCELPATVYDKNCKYNYENYCYTPYNQLETSRDAKNFCASSGSNLTSIHSANENRFLVSILPSYSIIVLGGFAFSKNVVLWLDGTPTIFINAILINRGNCLFLSSQNGHWFGYDCLTEKAHFVCKQRISGQ
ncbi:C-type lectin domain-containing protein [Caenorhabditis elegans]|uniref:C-type lectin domain-containing protein n=1 Tax=Caenorhabditis elegans TaxID=6239 RepID=O45531_CAEEL|nr:C-type lectin domain-containing protein [Caenorhabditis elegans]CAB04416.3 C-type lectin domain-containing protein [Caenorhabditis elegans]|eukprot:NP_001343583.1 C-type LECtin [Caenorhabditis elegans]